jgi:hypothetical protein
MIKITQIVKGFPMVAEVQTVIFFICARICERDNHINISNNKIKYLGINRIRRKYKTREGAEWPRAGGEVPCSCWSVLGS